MQNTILQILHSHCHHELRAAVLNCIGPEKEWLCRLSEVSGREAHRPLPLTVGLLATVRQREPLLLVVYILVSPASSTRQLQIYVHTDLTGQTQCASNKAKKHECENLAQYGRDSWGWEGGRRDSAGSESNQNYYIYIYGIVKEQIQSLKINQKKEKRGSRMYINNYLSNTGKSNGEQIYVRGRPRSSIKEKFNNSNMRKTEKERL